MNKRKVILFFILTVLILMQFVKIDKNNPESKPENDFLVANNAPREVEGIIKKACYDCHSNHTIYPWYTNIAPVSWWIKGHIDEGREHLNFSDWMGYTAKKKAHKLEETMEAVGEAWMPLDSYTWAHAEADLSQEERDILMVWLKNIKIN